MITTVVLISLCVGTFALPISFGLSSGYLNFNSSVLTRSVKIPHYSTPLVAYSLSSIYINDYFSYASNYSKVTSNQSDSFSFNVIIGGVYAYKLTLMYAILESMPNTESVFLNLTFQKTLKMYTSKKGIRFDQDTYIAAHLIGFSSSNLTKDNFFYAAKFNLTYSVYTNTKLNENDWVAVNFFILQANYAVNNTICIGSYINSESQINNKRSPMTIQVESQLNFLLGIQAIFLPVADFKFNQTTSVVEMKSTGAYSFSIIVINNTCNYIYDTKLQESSRQGRIYMGLMIVFIILFAILSGTIIICWVLKRCLKEGEPVGNSSNVDSEQTTNKKDQSIGQSRNPRFKKQNGPVHLGREQYVQNDDVHIGSDMALNSQVRLITTAVPSSPCRCSQCGNMMVSAGDKCQKCRLEPSEDDCKDIEL